MIPTESYLEKGIQDWPEPKDLLGVTQKMRHEMCIEFIAVSTSEFFMLYRNRIIGFKILCKVSLCVTSFAIACL